MFSEEVVGSINNIMSRSILKTSNNYKSGSQIKSENSNHKHCSFDDKKTTVIDVDNWKELNAKNTSEPDECACNCRLI